MRSDVPALWPYGFSFFSQCSLFNLFDQQFELAGALIHLYKLYLQLGLASAKVWKFAK